MGRSYDISVFLNPMSYSDSPKRGFDVLRDPRLNKGTAFTRRERQELGIVGLLPDIVSSMEMQMERIEGHVDSLTTDLDKYVYLSDLQERNESLFYAMLQKDPVKYMPIVYTPTVGLACQTFGRIYRRPKGMFISVRNRGVMAEVLRNWPERDVRWICVTDGERILGLGDLGAQGMGIPVGKLALYTACAGVPPEVTLPIVLDVGTNSEALLEDPFYIGVRQRRLQGQEYDDFIEEFVTAVQEVFPKCAIQWEDFANPNASPILERYRHRISSFNDDIQGTAAVGVAGVIAATRMKGERLKDQTYMFLGAGSAGIGIAELLWRLMIDEGCTEEEARAKCWLMDSRGLIVASRPDVEGTQKAPYAHEHADAATLIEAVRAVRPTVLIGTSTTAKAFTQEVIEHMASYCERPIIFPFSNPTSKSECSAEEAYTWTQGRAIFASGSPFKPVEINGQTIHPGQGNNVYIFPGVGLAAYAVDATNIPYKTFGVAAWALAGMVSQEQFDKGLIYPPMSDIQKAAKVVAVACAEYLFEDGHAGIARPDDVTALVESHMWRPAY
jgi:malate dehydrogenase (oxaloacetate-decarboxylating)(NADP+)